MIQVNITYFVHGTTIDNQEHKASGQADVELSELGIRQSKELKETIKDKHFDIVFSSDLKRAVESATIVFGGRVEIIQDKRLRECDYGNLTGGDSKEVKSNMVARVDEPYPNGESYRDVEKRIRDFLSDLLKKYPNKNIAIVSHEAPQLALEVILNGKTWEQSIKDNWRPKGKWQPGWDYVLTEDKIQ